MDILSTISILIIVSGILALASIIVAYKLLKANPRWILAIIFFWLTIIFLIIPDPFFLEIIGAVITTLTGYYAYKGGKGK